jgi:hypothetical protein
MLIEGLNISTLVVSILGGGGIVGGLIALLKVRTEKDSIIVASATDTVEAQTVVLKNLQREIERQARTIDILTSKIEDLTIQNKVLADQVEKLTKA